MSAFFELGDGTILGVDNGWKCFRREFLKEGWRRPLTPQPMAIWDAQTGLRLSFLQGHHLGLVIGADLLSDGRLITWGRDYIIRVWDRATGCCTDVLPLPLWPHPPDRRAVLSGDMFADMKPTEKQRYVNNRHLQAPNVQIDWIVKPGGEQHSYKCAPSTRAEQTVVSPWRPTKDEHGAHRILDVEGVEAGYSTWLLMNDGRLLGGGTTYGTSGQFYVWDGFYSLRILIVGRHDCNMRLKGEIEPNVIVIENTLGIDEVDIYRFEL